MKSIIISHNLPDTAIPRFQYTVNFINHHPLKPHKLEFVIDNNVDNCDIFYGEKAGEDSFFIPNAQAFLYPGRVHRKKNTLAHYSCQDKTIYAIVTGEQIQRKLLLNNRFAFDIFSNIFYFISRYEEVFATPQNMSSRGWLDEPLHFLVKNKIQDIPVLDVLLVAFFEIFTNETIKKRSTYSISHDVDIFYKFSPFSRAIKSVLSPLYYQKNITDSIYNFTTSIQSLMGIKKDPYDYFEKLILKENNTWKEKHIYFMTGGNTKFDNHYKITDPNVTEIIHYAQKNRYQIGLHPSFNAGFDHQMYREELNKLNEQLKEKVQINRQHWLRWSWEITPYLLKENNINRDSSMGYNDYLGFRCGTGFPYYMYDFKNEKAFSWKELPLVFMDSSAIHYCRNNQKKLKDEITSFVSKNKFNTHLMMNFHNSNFDYTLHTGKVLSSFYEDDLISFGKSH